MTFHNTQLEKFYNFILQRNVFPSREKMIHSFGELFRGVSLKDKNILDIGGGDGLYSFFAALSGAKKVICLEPEIEGSSLGVQNQFRLIQQMLALQNVTLEGKKLQDFNTSDRFDVVILHNSINHLDEDSCINLKKDIKAQQNYRLIFNNIFNIMNPGGILTVTDCAQSNFWSDILKIKNPFMPTIEWHKHNSPNLWGKILHDVGFELLSIRWGNYLSNKYFRPISKYILYFYSSTFTLYARKNL